MSIYNLEEVGEIQNIEDVINMASIKELLTIEFPDPENNVILLKKIVNILYSRLIDIEDKIKILERRR